GGSNTSWRSTSPSVTGPPRYSEPPGGPAMPVGARSILVLLRGLLDRKRDGKHLAAAAVARAAQGCGAELIEPHGNAHMRVGRADFVDRIECDPAQPRNVGLGPGKLPLLPHRIVAATKIAADVACRDTEAARGGNEHVGQVLAG